MSTIPHPTASADAVHENGQAEAEPPKKSPPSAADMERWLEVLMGDDQVVEVRGLKMTRPSYRRRHTEAGYFDRDNRQKAVRSARDMDANGKAQGVYITLNTLNPDVLARRCNHAEPAENDELTTDRDVIRRRWILIDCDPKRTRGVSSTAEEWHKAKAKALAVREFLRARGWPDPIFATSGNGCHLLYRVDLPADDGGMVKAVLKALAALFDDDEVSIDTSVHNPSRITKFYGTVARKGDNTPERSWKYSGVLEIPEPVQVVPEAMLKALADEAPKPEAPARPASANGAAAPRKKRGTVASAPTPEERGLACVLAMKDSVAGQHGHTQLFAVACTLRDEFGLDEAAMLRCLRKYNEAKAFPPESEKQLAHKVADAIKKFPIPSLGLLNAPMKGRAEPSTNGDGQPHPEPDPSQDQAGEVTDRRPEIVITTDEHIVIDQVIAAIEDDPDVYQRGNVLVTVVRESTARRRKRDARRPAGSPRIVQLPKPRAREIIVRNARITKEVETKRGTIRVPAHPSDFMVSGPLARGEYPDVRPIEGVVEAPTLREDGSLLDIPGWDDQTGLLYEPNAEFPPIPNLPTRMDAREAANLLFGLVVDFPFAPIVTDGVSDGGAAHRAMWLASLLTVLARHAIDGPTPLFVFDGNTPGCGKSKLADIDSIIATGREMARADYPDEEVEMAKVLLSIALAADPAVLFDNVSTGFSVGGKSIDRVLTARTVKGRILGRSEMTAEMDWITVLFATGNNLGIKGDAQRRIGIIRLETDEEHPEERETFAIEDLTGYVKRERGRLVAAGLTILRAYIVAGRPKPKLTPMDYPAWCGLIRNAIHWATGIDPCAGRKALKDSDTESSSRAALIEGWSELPGAETGVTVAQALKLLQEHQTSYGTLREALLEKSRTRDLPSSISIGMRLNAIKGRVVNGKALRPISISNHVKAWKVVQAVFQGTSGTKGTNSNPSHARENSDSQCVDKNSLGAGDRNQFPQSPQFPCGEEVGDAWEPPIADRPQAVPSVSIWLADQLSDGPKRIGLTLSAADRAGIAHEALYRVVKLIGVATVDREDGRYWELTGNGPAEPKDPVSEASDWLVGYLIRESAPLAEIMAAAAEAGFDEATTCAAFLATRGLRKQVKDGVEFWSYG